MHLVSKFGNFHLILVSVRLDTLTVIYCLSSFDYAWIWIGAFLRAICKIDIRFGDKEFENGDSVRRPSIGKQARVKSYIPVRARGHKSCEGLRPCGQQR